MNLVRFLSRYTPRPAKNAYRRLFGYEQWFLAVNPGPPLADSLITGRPPATQLKIHHAPPPAVSGPTPSP